MAAIDTVPSTEEVSTIIYLVEATTVTTLPVAGVDGTTETNDKDKEATTTTLISPPNTCTIELVMTTKTTKKRHDDSHEEDEDEEEDDEDEEGDSDDEEDDEDEEEGDTDSTMISDDDHHHHDARSESTDQTPHLSPVSSATNNLDHQESSEKESNETDGVQSIRIRGKIGQVVPEDIGAISPQTNVLRTPRGTNILSPRETPNNSNNNNESENSSSQSTTPTAPTDSDGAAATTTTTTTTTSKATEAEAATAPKDTVVVEEEKKTSEEHPKVAPAAETQKEETVIPRTRERSSSTTIAPAPPSSVSSALNNKNDPFDITKRASVSTAAQHIMVAAAVMEDVPPERKVRALYDFNGRNDAQLNIKKGEIFSLMKKGVEGKGLSLARELALVLFLPFCLYNCLRIFELGVLLFLLLNETSLFSS